MDNRITSLFNKTTFSNNKNNSRGVERRVKGISERSRLQTASILTEFYENPDL